jgi:predicted phage terminase large subunit-like protein
VFGHIVGEGKWTDKQWIRAGSRWIGSNYATVFTGGPGGQTASKRFDVILCDDIIDDENVQTVDQMEAIERWFWKTLYPCLAKDGVIIVVGTRWGEGDLYEQLFADKPKGKGWKSLIRSALFEQDGALHSLWPSEFPVERLLAMRDDMGSAVFSCSMLNDISGLMSGFIFKQEWFQYFDVLPEGEYTYRMGVDLASSTRERADYTARVVIAENRQGDFYVMNAYREKMESGHAQFVNNGFAAFPQISSILVETVQFQSTLVAELMRDYPRLPVRGKKTDTDKTTRGRAVAARYEGHKVFHHYSLRDTDFERELLSFPKGHDDWVDSLGFAMDLGGGDFSFSVVRNKDLKIAGKQPIDQQQVAAAVKTQEADILSGEMKRILASHFGR